MASRWRIGHTNSKLIASFVSLTVNLTNSQIESTLAPFADAFNIPIHNRSIYFSRLASLRFLLILVGCVFEYLSYTCYSKFEKSKKYRFYVSITCLSSLFLTRVIFLIVQYFSPLIAYDTYIILAIEAFFTGLLYSIGALIPEHSAAMVFGHHSCRVMLPLFQLFVNCIIDSSLLSVKIQTSLNVSLTAISIALWTFFVNSIDELHSHDIKEIKLGKIHNIQNEVTVRVSKNIRGRYLGFFETFGKAISPFLMFPIGSMFKDFLFPLVLPFALLKKDFCIMIHLLGPTADLLGASFIFGLESFNCFYKWDSSFDAFWLLVIPMGMIFICSMLAIHTQMPLARFLINSKKWVLLTTVGVVLGNGFLDPLSFGGVSRVVKPDLVGILRCSKRSILIKEGDFNVITYHFIFSMILSFIFKKLSVGYNDIRVSLGYSLPKFRPTHRMSKSNLGWYIFKNTFKRAWKDTGNDFKLDIKKYI